MCAVNTVGRVMAGEPLCLVNQNPTCPALTPASLCLPPFLGVISDWRCTDALVVNNGALIISGIACVLLPALSSYAGHVCFAATYGGAIGK